MSLTYNTFRLADAELVSSLASIVDQLDATKNANITIYVDEPNQKSVTCAIAEYSKHTEMAGILALGASVITRAHITVPTVSSSTVNVVRAASFLTVTVATHQNTPAVLAAKLSATCQAVLRPFERDASFDKLLGEELAEFYRKREQSLLKLEDVAQNLIQRNDAFRQRLEEDADRLRTDLRNDYESKMSTLNKAHEDRENALSARESALNEKLKALDDRSSRHARRQIRQDLKAAIASRNEQFSLTPKTVGKRKIIHLLFCSMISLLGCLVYLVASAQQATGGNASDWLNMARLPAATLATIAAIIYYIRWNDQWFKRHADEEFNVKRFELDIDRASWVVEMAMEWKDEKGSDIPAQIVDRLTVNLFDNSAHEPTARHPSEDLASALLGASSEVSMVGPGGSSIKLDRKGMRQFRKATADKDE